MLSQEQFENERENIKKLRSESHTFLKSHTHLSKRSYYRKEREDGEKKKNHQLNHLRKIFQNLEPQDTRLERPQNRKDEKTCSGYYRDHWKQERKI